MPTIISHAAVPLALAFGLGRKAIPRRLLVAGVAASMLPDVDVLAFSLGIAYSDAFGHRGFTHSVAFALAAGAAALLLSRWLQCARLQAFLFVGVSTVSHGLLDMFTNGGSGVELWWPLSTERFFWPVRPIEVSPLSLERLISARGMAVLQSELLWVWLPAALACTVLLLLRRTRDR
jgi:inner membrane protein